MAAPPRTTTAIPPRPLTPRRVWKLGTKDEADQRLGLEAGAWLLVSIVLNTSPTNLFALMAGLVCLSSQTCVSEMIGQLSTTVRVIHHRKAKKEPP